MEMKGTIIFSIIALLTMFGMSMNVQTSYMGFDMSINVHDVQFKGHGEYDLIASIGLKNTNDYDVSIYSTYMTVYTNDTCQFKIFEYSVDDVVIIIRSGETFESGKLSGHIVLDNDVIPDRVYVVFSNVKYMIDGELKNPSEYGFWFDLDLYSYLP